MNVLVLCGSIRARERNREVIFHLSESDGGPEGMAALGGKFGRKGYELCNSEIMAAAAMMGARELGAHVEYFSLKGLFARKEKSVVQLREKKGNALEELSFFDTLELLEEELAHLYEMIETADGIVLSTPVYFGDRSSVANKFMQITSKKNLLKNKVFGVVSVGAKRNGGQETCNVYTMIEALNQRALVVGNGPPTSQYGGTGVGGNQMHVLEDLWGLETARGAGRKVAHVSEVYSKGGHASETSDVRIDILVTMDTEERFLAGYIRDLAERVSSHMPWMRFQVHELIDSTIYRCLACKVCPIEPTTGNTRPVCAIKDPEDYLEVLRDALADSDGIIIAGLNILDMERVIFRYQVVTERMRYFRRNDFELSDSLIGGLCYNQFGATMNAIHSIKVLTSYIRQNTTVFHPIEILEHEQKLLDIGKTALVEFCQAAKRIKAGRKLVHSQENKYLAYGAAGGYKVSGT